MGSSETDTSRRIVIVGSANIDLVVQADRFPEGGETVRGTGLRVVPGGKGANQAVAVAKAGGEAFFVGKVGDDVFATNLINSLRASGVDTKFLRIEPGASTGTAVVLVEPNGENRIIVVRGANDALRPSDIEGAKEAIVSASIMLVQLEIPFEAVERAITIAHQAGVKVILDPAPAPVEAVPSSIFEMVDVVTPNQHEAAVLTNLKSIDSVCDAERAACKLVSMGAKTAIVKLGANGAVVLERRGEPIHLSGYKVSAVDTTGAGDTFAGGLAVALSEGRSVWEAACFANAAAALSVQKMGAQASIPERQEIFDFMASEAQD